MLSQVKMVFMSGGRLPLFCNGAMKLIFTQSYATNVGNSLISNVNESAGLPQKWMKFWFFNMKRKAEVEGPDAPMPRANLRNWNYKAELLAFQTRLGLNCESELLQVAFRDPIPSDVDENLPNDNSELSAAGKQFTESFISHYVKIALPLLPDEGQLAIEAYLTNKSTLAHIANHLGHQDLLQTITFPPTEESLANCFLAVLQVINVNEGPVAAGRFLLDFILPFLNGKDILDDIWKPNDPMFLLAKERKQRNLPLPESRLSKQSGINTVLPVFHVALFSGSDLLAESGGESIILAETDSAKQALKHLYKIHPNTAALPMGMSVDNEFLKKLFEPLLASDVGDYEFYTIEDNKDKLPGV